MSKTRHPCLEVTKNLFGPIAGAKRKAVCPQMRWKCLRKKIQTKQELYARGWGED